MHPSQLYNAATGLLLFAGLWLARKRFKVPGVLFWTFVILFALVRLPIDMTRAYEPEAVLLRVGLAEITESQIMSIGMALFGMLMIVRLRRAAPASAA